mmetsp:Transcript_39168/g.80221  ORF Transcript_39168/g.80221 Transcript_39168/m.80221 type:complete len:318 (+) Transcript_39168:1663-2616(+)
MPLRRNSILHSLNRHIQLLLQSLHPLPNPTSRPCRAGILLSRLASHRRQTLPQGRQLILDARNRGGSLRELLKLVLQVVDLPARVAVAAQLGLPRALEARAEGRQLREHRVHPRERRRVDGTDFRPPRVVFRPKLSLQRGECLTEFTQRHRRPLRACCHLCVQPVHQCVHLLEESVALDLELVREIGTQRCCVFGACSRVRCHVCLLLLQACCLLGAQLLDHLRHCHVQPRVVCCHVALQHVHLQLQVSHPRLLPTVCLALRHAAHLLCHPRQRLLDARPLLRHAITRSLHRLRHHSAQLSLQPRELSKQRIARFAD